MKHVDDNNAHRVAQPESTKAPTGERNPDNRTNSGYPAGGDQIEKGKDAYGRGPSERRMAELPRGEGNNKQPSTPRSK